MEEEEEEEEVPLFFCSVATVSMIMKKLYPNFLS
jgi:hypothetical protein